MIGVAFNVQEMDVVGRSKVRHVGGWAVRKVLSQARTYLTRLFLTCNVYSIDITAIIIVDITSHNFLKFHVGFNR